MGERTLTLVEEPPILVTEHLSKQFGRVQALKDVSLKIPQGRIVGLLGPNGGGKTTLIKTLAGLYVDYQGTARILDEKPSHVTKALVSYAPDRNSFSPHMTCSEAGEIYSKFFKDFREDKWYSMLDCFSLSTNRQIKEMSKGMIDKLQICLTMARDARLYLLDEPIAGVDVGARDVVLDQILENFNAQGTIIIATHLVAEIERLFDTVIFLNKGEVVEFDDCVRIREKYGDSLEQIMKEVF